jgi:hypothetical protein
MLKDMPSKFGETTQRIKDQIIRILSGLPWGSILVELLQQSFNLMAQSPSRGMYEVLEYESVLELLDLKGERARFRKRQKVRYLQDGIIAYQDQAWGDGKFMLHYRCSPGQAVDRYRLGHKTIILISLREVKNRGSEDEFHITRNIRSGFLGKQEQWETDISHSTRRLLLKLVFPKERPPQRVDLIENIRQRTLRLTHDHQRQLPDGKWLVAWETNAVQTNERYILKWSW